MKADNLHTPAEKRAAGKALGNAVREAVEQKKYKSIPAFGEACGIHNGQIYAMIRAGSFSRDAWKRVLEKLPALEGVLHLDRLRGAPNFSASRRSLAAKKSQKKPPKKLGNKSRKPKTAGRVLAKPAQATAARVGKASVRTVARRMPITCFSAVAVILRSPRLTKMIIDTSASLQEQGLSLLDVLVAAQSQPAVL